MGAGTGAMQRVHTMYWGPMPEYEFVPRFRVEGLLRVNRKSGAIDIIPVHNGQPTPENTLSFDGKLRAEGIEREVEIAVANTNSRLRKLFSPAYRRGELNARVERGLLVEIKGRFWLSQTTLDEVLSNYNGKQVMIEVSESREKQSGSPSSAGSRDAAEDEEETKSPERPVMVNVDKVGF